MDTHFDNVPLFKESMAHLEAYTNRKHAVIERLMSDLKATDNFLSKCTKDGTITLVKGFKAEREHLRYHIKREKDRLKQISSFDRRSFDIILEELKQSSSYKEMNSYNDIYENMKLTDAEALALILYCDYNDYFNHLRNTCLYQKLFEHICEAVKKMHKVFHLKNKEYLQNKSIGTALYYEASLNRLTSQQQEKYVLNDVTSFTCNLSVSQSWGRSIVSVLLMENAKQAIYNGKIIAADVSWIQRDSNQSNFIVLPAEYYDMKIFRFVPNKNKHLMIPEEINICSTSNYSSKYHVLTRDWLEFVAHWFGGVFLILFFIKIGTWFYFDHGYELPVYYMRMMVDQIWKMYAMVQYYCLIKLNIVSQVCIQFRWFPVFNVRDASNIFPVPCCMVGFIQGIILFDAIYKCGSDLIYSLRDLLSLPFWIYVCLSAFALALYGKRVKLKQVIQQFSAFINENNSDSTSISAWNL